ncbi:uncharacterized protein LOC6582187 isoform X2 [Drosophila mojavensis]|uniref:Uncharacterized protein, isoform B n=1 Tax=Drosophila mojavensis TaxID=7230 RepID=A0A0Q9XQ98_DROMO|nr:uncharacterized protein LOC6582187 isoform X2 [Drosophila mojavensis]KRG06147.1 uncharacterized protein Dmoj_GI12126, isoform B [Drosophila mojavensis]
MPSRRSGGVGTTRRKHSLGNLRRAHPASGATWNVQVVRGKMSSKCLWHACRALILGLALMLVGAGMATLGYYADHLSMGSELRGNVTVRVKNDLKGFHLNNFAYVGPIVMGFGGFIVVASCVMTFEARDSAAKVVPARLRAGAGSCNKTTTRSNQGSSASQRRGMGAQYQSTRWDQHFGVFRSSPGDPHQQLQAVAGAPSSGQTQAQPFDREALTTELINFSKSLSSVRRVRPSRSSAGSGSVGLAGGIGGAGGSNARLISNSSSLIQRATREHSTCTLLQPPAASRVYWQASSFDAGIAATHSSAGSEKRAERNKRSDTAKRHVLARQRPIEHEEAARDRCSPLGHRRNSTMSDSSYSGRWTARCASVASRTSSIDSRRVQVDLHSPEVMPKSILRSPKRYSSGPSATPSVDKEFRSQLSVCSEPPPPVRQLSGQSSMEPAVPEESVEIIDERMPMECVSNSNNNSLCNVSYNEITELVHHTHSLPMKKQRPDFLPLDSSADPKPHQEQQQQQQQQQQQKSNPSTLYRSNSSRQFYRPKPAIAKDRDDSVFYIRSLERGGSSASNDEHMYDSLKVINERRSTLLKADSQSSLGSAERKLSSFSLKMPDITERENSIDIEEGPPPPLPPPPITTQPKLAEDSPREELEQIQNET